MIRTKFLRALFTVFQSALEFKVEAHCKKMSHGGSPCLPPELTLRVVCINQPIGIPCAGTHTSHFDVEMCMIYRTALVEYQVVVSIPECLSFTHCTAYHPNFELVCT